MINPMNMTSNLSNWMKIRRNSFSLLNSRSTSFRFLYSTLSYSQGTVQLLFSGTTGVKSYSELSFLVLSPSYALSMIIAHDSGTAPISVRIFRPSGSSPAWPGEKENITAHSADSAIKCSFFPASAGFADRLRAFFLNAYVPSGCTLIMVLSTLRQLICSCCNRLTIRSSPPFLLQRLIRVYICCANC